MDTLLGVPIEGWTSIAIWLFVIAVPWTYGLYFLRRIDASGVERWGAKTGPHDAPPADGEGR